jgi:hypothetical protein
MPWMTFLAFVVTDVTIIAAVLWAIGDRRRGDNRGS